MVSGNKNTNAGNRSAVRVVRSLHKRLILQRHLGRALAPSTEGHRAQNTNIVLLASTCPYDEGLEGAVEVTCPKLMEATVMNGNFLGAAGMEKDVEGRWVGLENHRGEDILCHLTVPQGTGLSRAYCLGLHTKLPSHPSGWAPLTITHPDPVCPPHLRQAG